MEEVSVYINTKLEQLLKYADFVSSGGEAKLAIQDGRVTINGNTETRRGYKVKDGDIVSMGTISIKVSLHE